MPKNAEQDVTYSIDRDLTYHGRADNALHTITFGRVRFLQANYKEISTDVRRFSLHTEDEIKESLKSGKLKIKNAPQFLGKIMELRHLDDYSNEYLGETIKRLKAKGLPDFIRHCQDKNISPLLGLAYQAVNHGRHPKDLDHQLIHDLSSEADTNRGLNRYLNHVSLIVARELGLVNRIECLLLRSLSPNLTEQNYEVNGLSTLLLTTLHLINKLTDQKYREVKTEDKELEQMFLGGSLISFSNKIDRLRGFLALQAEPQFSQSNLNWPEEIRG